MIERTLDLVAGDFFRQFDAVADNLQRELSLIGRNTVLLLFTALPNLHDLLKEVLG